MYIFPICCDRLFFESGCQLHTHSMSDKMELKKYLGTMDKILITSPTQGRRVKTRLPHSIIDHLFSLLGYQL